jgi:hypothetical protein
MLSGVARGRLVFMPLPSDRQEGNSAMKSLMPGPITLAALVTATCLATPAAAMPVDKAWAAAGKVSIENVGYVCGRSHCWRRWKYRYALHYIYPGLYSNCRPGWYCFGPDRYGAFRPAWYGGFNSIYGYQGARYRRAERSAEPTPTPPAAPPPTKEDNPPPPEPPR